MGPSHRDLGTRSRRDGFGRRVEMLFSLRWSTFVIASIASAIACWNRRGCSTFRKRDPEEGYGKQLDAPGIPLRALRRAETVLRRRCTRIIAVLERCSEDRNHEAVLRTCECLGIQTVWIVEPSEKKKPNGRNLDANQRALKTKREKLVGMAGFGVARQTQRWLTVKSFQSTSDCLEALREGGFEIWTTDVSCEAESLETAVLEPLPKRVAVVFGREATGVSPEFLSASDRRLYLQLHGFTESLNLSVAAALVLHTLLVRFPDARGDTTEAEKKALRKNWFWKLGRNDEQRHLYVSFADGPPLEPFADVRPHPNHRTVLMSPSLRHRLEEREGPLVDHLRST